MAQPSNVTLAVLLIVGSVLGGACLTLTHAPSRPPLVILAQNVERVDAAAAPDPVPSERFVPHVWRLEELYARVGDHWVPREAREVIGAVTLAWDGFARFLQLANDVNFTGERRHFEVQAGSFRLPQVFSGRNFWRVSLDGRKWSPAREFEVENEFVPGAPEIRGRDALTLKGFARYVVEYAAEPTFVAPRALVIDASVFRPGARGFIRARGINERGEVSALSRAHALP